MRPPRIAILALFLVASLFVVGRALASTSRSASTYPARPRSSRSVWNFMYYNTPFSLFPPNAAISLTDDNSTSFAARPAAFGPRLAPQGLSGRLWVGSGFAEDTVDGDGELGCSDLSGWETGNSRAALKNAAKALAGPRISTATRKTDPAERGDQLLDAADREAMASSKRRDEAPAVDDGTDDYLHQGLASPFSRRDSSASSAHADIQSMQESAEIHGNIVLLMRGGCGFLEKVMWAQRRGAVAVIVGDNRKGGPLIQMFAHGEEVENVTIPSVFTARTTAQLLSSLTQPGSYIEDLVDENGHSILKVQQSPKTTRTRKTKTLASVPPVFPRSPLAPAKEKRSVTEKDERSESTGAKSPSFLSRVFSLGSSPRSVQDQSRPPRSGRLDWVLVEDWSDEKDKMISESMNRNGKDDKSSTSPEDDFVIGVHDWRDPDLVDKSGSKSNSRGKPNDKKTSLKAAAQSEDSRKNPGNVDANRPMGGSITPGSGEYNPAAAQSKDNKDTGSRSGISASAPAGKAPGFMSKIFGDHEDDLGLDDVTSYRVDDYADDVPRPHEPEHRLHDGLWVTIIPTSSASPFFDTLLVLVVSPLVTLTVVYSLLILRARIRRRRWRAPKSVVEQLPVRTYHTVAPSPTMTPRLPSPSSASPTTPLLQQSSSRPRPRSRTTTGVFESPNFLTSTPAVPTPRARSRAGNREHEKGASGFSAEWRKYMGRQVECVVCLEEYEDGVSRVMSLPCGHEFHADCITPWLTTRRRTCPICKGDVVRSLARGSSSGPRYEPYQDDSDDEPGAEASRSRSADRGSDVEQGIFSPDNREPDHSGSTGGWLGLLSSSFGARPQPRSRSRSPEGRDR